MSFYTEIQVHHTDFEEVDISTVKMQILDLLQDDAIHSDVYESILTAFTSGKASINADSVYCCDLFKRIIKLLPNANFECRGLGEEFFYTWIICVSDGEIIYLSEPWETDNPFI